LSKAEVEVGTSFLGLNVLIEDEVEDLLAGRDEVDETGVIGVVGSNAAFFIIPISDLYRASTINPHALLHHTRRASENLPQLIILAPEILQFVPDRVDQSITILDMILEFVDISLSSVPKRSGGEFVPQLSLLL
jgi:hypothetical protein